MSSGTAASDPSVGDYADTSPAELGRKASHYPTSARGAMKRVISAST